MFRLYRYVGPADIAEHVAGGPAGHVVRSSTDLAVALGSLGGMHPGQILTVTFVVDALGQLRIADRSSEHVACAGGAVVMAAGELGVMIGEIPSVEEASNQSTGFCPEPGSWAALRHALAAAGISRPDGWTTSFDFRRCEGCGSRALVKEGCFDCAECGGCLPQAWNLDRTRVSRSVVGAGDTTWLIDAVEEAASSDQDRVAVVLCSDGPIVIVADGAGGVSGGAAAAERAVELLRGAVLDSPHRCADALTQADRLLAAQATGETTVVVAKLQLRHDADSFGASAGDSMAWARAGGQWIELTADQHRKPLVGSGRARPFSFGPRAGVDAVLVGTDGLFKYARWADIVAEVGRASWDLPWRLADLARLSSGGLQDDLAAVLVRRAG